MLSYSIDAEKINLDDLRKRIESTDLVPSRVPLLDRLESKMKVIEQQGIATLARLRNELKNPKRLDALASATGIDVQYLVLLRREIEGYFPKPCALKSFDWLPAVDVAKLEQQGIADTAALYEATGSAQKRAELIQSSGVDAATLEAFVQLADLSRVQWVSPIFARMLVAAGYDSVTQLAQADAEVLCAALAQVNAGERFFKGKIGLRDVKRLIRAAQF